MQQLEANVARLRARLEWRAKHALLLGVLRFVALLMVLYLIAGVLLAVAAHR